jgi:Icc protein
MKDNSVDLSLHGHVHYYSLEEVYDDGVKYLTVPSLDKPEYCVVKVNIDSFEVEQVAL